MDINKIVDQWYDDSQDEQSLMQSQIALYQGSFLTPQMTSQIVTRVISQCRSLARAGDVARGLLIAAEIFKEQVKTLEINELNRLMKE